MVAVLNLNLSLNVLMVDWPKMVLWPKIRLLPASQSAVMRAGKISLAQKSNQEDTAIFGYIWGSDNPADRQKYLKICFREWVEKEFDKFDNFFDNVDNF